MVKKSGSKQQNLRLIESHVGRILEAGKDGSEWDVILIQEGFSKNFDADTGLPRYYTADALRSAKSLFENAKAFAYFYGEGPGRFDHLPDQVQTRMPAGVVGNLVGWFTNVRIREISGKVALIARFHISESAKWLRELMRDAFQSGQRDMVGFSIDALGKSKIGLAEGKRASMVTSFDSVGSVDVVTSPAAGGRAMRLVASCDFGGTMKESEILTYISKEFPEWTKEFDLKEASEDETSKMLRRVLEGCKKNAEDRVKEAKAGDDSVQILTENQGLDTINMLLMLLEEKKVDEAMRLLRTMKAKHEVPGEEGNGNQEPSAGAEESATGGDTMGDTNGNAATLEQVAETQKKTEEALARIQERERELLFKELFMESGLADKSQDRIRKLFEGKDVTKDLLETAIGEEKSFVAELRASDGNPTGVGNADTADVSVGKEERDRWQDSMDKMFAAEEGGFGSLHESWATITGHMDSDRRRLARSIMKAMAFAIPGDPDVPFEEHHQMLRESHMLDVRPRFGSKRFREATIDTTTWANTFGDSIRRILLKYYTAPEANTWRPLVNIMNAADFRTLRLIMRRGFKDLANVTEGGTYQEFDNPTDTESTFAVSKFGGLVTVTLEAVTNDDLGAVRRIPLDLGQASARTLSKRVLDTCLFDNPNVDEDSTGIITAGHNNNTTVALSFAEVILLREKMLKQTDPFTGERLNIRPKYLVYPVDLEDTAWEIINSNVKISTNEDLTVPSFVKNRLGLIPILNPWNTSTTKYFLVANPAENPTIAVAFLGGRQNPELFVQDQPNVGSSFTADKTTWKVRHIYECKALDFRSFSGRVA